MNPSSGNLHPAEGYVFLDVSDETIEALLGLDRRRRAGLVIRREERQPRNRGALESAEGIGLVRPVELPRAGREAGEMVLRALVVAHDFLKARGVLLSGNMMIQLQPGRRHP